MTVPNVVYNGEHSVTFTDESGENTYNTWTDWGLVPSSRPSEPVNSIWNNKVSVSGINGEEDLVRMYPFNSINSYSKLRSAIKYDNRDYIKTNYGYDIFQPSSGSLSYIIADQSESFFAKQQTLLNLLHNRTMKMKFKDDPSKTYTVRTTVESFSSGANYSTISISYSVINEN